MIYFRSVLKAKRFFKNLCDIPNFRDALYDKDSKYVFDEKELKFRKRKPRRKR